MAFALLPSLLGSASDYWDNYDYPNRIMDQFFGDALVDNELLPPSLFHGYVIRPRTQSSINTSGKSEVENESEEFKVALDVSQFKPEELEVKIIDDYLVVHAKHEERVDEHGFIAREFKRRYILPKTCEQDKITSSLTPEGILVIKAPKVPPPEAETKERQIPITQE